METVVKKVCIALILGLTLSQISSASEVKYQCVADLMQSINSDIYYALSPADIDEMLQIPEFLGHTDAVMAVERCEMRDENGITAKGYQCMADAMQAVNSDIYYNLSSVQIDEMIQIVEFAGHQEAMQAARKCKVY